MKKWTFDLEDGSEVTFYEQAIACIHWTKDQKVSRGPDRCRVVLANGQMIDMLRGNTKILYADVVEKSEGE